MSTYTGKEGTFKVGGTIIGEFLDFTVSDSADEIEDSEASDEWKTFKSGTDLYKSWTADVNAHLHLGNAQQGALDIGASVSVEFFPEGDVSTRIKLSGTAVVLQRTLTTNRGGINSAAFSLRGTGALTEAAI